MEQKAMKEAIAKVSECMMEGGYSKSTIQQFNNTTNQLLAFMDSKGTSEYTTEVGLQFLQDHHGFDATLPVNHSNAERLRHLRKLSEFLLHGYVILKRNAGYDIPAAFLTATTEFLAKRRFEGIRNKNMTVITLYLERFFQYLQSREINKIDQITGVHIHQYLRFITGFSNPSKNHMMRTVRQFMTFCFQKGYHCEDLSSYAPNVRYEKRSRLPSAYTRDEVEKLLKSIDRSNPIGKRDYAIIMLITRLGLRAGDVVNLKFENVDWEGNKISLTQHKTGKPLVLPLLEDVGVAMIDYLKFGRPKCDDYNIFMKHSIPTAPCTSHGMYDLVSTRLSRAGIVVGGRKSGPHALRHSLASRLLEENIPLPVISEILGYSNFNTTAAYLSVDIDKLRQCALEV